MSKFSCRRKVIYLMLLTSLSLSVWARDYEEATKASDSVTVSTTEETTSPSFDCNKNKTKAEQVICDLPQLAEADRQLAAVYTKLQQSLSKTELSVLKTAQLQWLKQRDTTVLNCENVDCAVQFYQTQIEKLQSQLEAAKAKSVKRALVKDSVTTANQSAVYGIVTTDSSVLNIRAGMGTDLPVIAKIPKGTKVRILDQIAGWYKVLLENDQVGYASSDYITVDSSTEESSEGNSEGDAEENREGNDEGDSEESSEGNSEGSDEENTDGKDENVIASEDNREWVTASFDCEKAKSPVEQLICREAKLSDADGRLGKLYLELQHSLSPAQVVDLREEQKKWLKVRNQQLLKCAEDVQCAVAVYEQRLRELAAAATE